MLLLDSGLFIFRRNLLQRPLGRLGMLHPGLYHLCQPLKRRDVALLESVSAVSEQFEHPDDFLFANQRNHHDRLDAQSAATLAVDAGIGLCVIAAQDLPGAYAFASQTRLHLYFRPQRRSRRTRASAANHFALFEQRDRRSRCPGNVLRALRQQLQRSFKVALRHLSQRFATVIRRQAQRLHR